MSIVELENAVLRKMAKEANVSISTMRMWLCRNKELNDFYDMTVKKCLEKIN